MRARTIAVAAVCAALTPASALALPDDPLVADDPAVTGVDARAGVVLWTQRDNDDQYRAFVRTGRGQARALAAQSSEDLAARLGRDARGRLVASYRRCSDDGKCGLYRVGLADGREVPIATRPPAGCADTNPVVERSVVLFARTCAGRGDGVMALRRGRARRLLALDGARVGAVDGDGRRIVAVARHGREARLHFARHDGGGAGTLFVLRPAADEAVRLIAPALAGGRVTWGAIVERGDLERATILRARVARGWPCLRDAARPFSGDSGGLVGVAADAHELLYAEAERGVRRAVSPPPAWTRTSCGPR